MKTFVKECRWGNFLLMRGDVVSSYADIYGEWSEMEVRLFQMLLAPHSNIVEVGSNIGLHAVPLAKMCAKGKVVCLEPQRIMFQMLCANAAMNNLLNVFAYHAAAGETDGQVMIETCDYDVTWNYGGFSIDKGMSRVDKFPRPVALESVDVVRLDSFAPVRELASIDLLKVDAETSEVAVLKGAAKTIAARRPFIFVENNDEQTGDALIAHIRNLGYKPYWFCSNRYQPGNFNRLSFEVPGYDTNMICVPEGRALPEKLSRLAPAERYAQLADGSVSLIQIG